MKMFPLSLPIALWAIVSSGAARATTYFVVDSFTDNVTEHGVPSTWDMSIGLPEPYDMAFSACRRAFEGKYYKPLPTVEACQQQESFSPVEKSFSGKSLHDFILASCPQLKGNYWQLVPAGKFAAWRKFDAGFSLTAGMMKGCGECDRYLNVRIENAPDALIIAVAPAGVQFKGNVTYGGLGNGTLPKLIKSLRIQDEVTDGIDLGGSPIKEISASSLLATLPNGQTFTVTAHINGDRVTDATVLDIDHDGEPDFIVNTEVEGKLLIFTAKGKIKKKIRLRVGKFTPKAC